MDGIRDIHMNQGNPSGRKKADPFESARVEWLASVYRLGDRPNVTDSTMLRPAKMLTLSCPLSGATVTVGTNGAL